MKNETRESRKQPILLLAIPDFVENAIKHYLDTDWSVEHDPSGIGSLNAVAYVGEKVIALYANQKREELANAKS